MTQPMAVTLTVNGREGQASGRGPPDPVALAAR